MHWILLPNYWFLPYLGNSTVTELHFVGSSRSLSLKFVRKEFYQLYLLKWFYAVDGDYFQMFTFAITPKF